MRTNIIRLQRMVDPMKKYEMFPNGHPGFLTKASRDRVLMVMRELSAQCIFLLPWFNSDSKRLSAEQPAIGSHTGILPGILHPGMACFIHFIAMVSVID